MGNAGVGRRCRPLANEQSADREGQGRGMDDRRFEEWTRALAGGVNRRRVVAGLAGITATLFGGYRQGRAQGLLGPGEACTATEQCSQTGGPQVCADNGIADDGALNCCRTQAGACAQSADCCGLLTCLDGFCVGDDEASPSGGQPLGGTCAATTECATVSGGRVICGDNGISEDGPLNCCLEEGSACTADANCCGAFRCTDGSCGTTGGGDLAPGEFCVSSAQCSQALGPAVCGSNASVADSPVCCLEEASACSTDQECCGEAVCADNGIGGDGGSNCCGYAGTACAVDAGCCADLFCLSGTCQSLG